MQCLVGIHFAPFATEDHGPLASGLIVCQIPSVEVDFRFGKLIGDDDLIESEPVFLEVDDPWDFKLLEILHHFILFRGAL
jgi:hypothetical protein